MEVSASDCNGKEGASLAWSSRISDFVSVEMWLAEMLWTIGLWSTAYGVLPYAETPRAITKHALISATIHRSMMREIIRRCVQNVSVRVLCLRTKFACKSCWLMSFGY